MITWIQNILQKHYKWLFSILLVVIITAFVFTIGNMPVGNQGSNPSQGPKIFYGFDLADKRTGEALARGRDITSMIDRTPYYQENQQQQAFFERAVLLYLADELQIPGPAREDIVSYMQSRRAFVDSDGNFSADQFTSFMDRLKISSPTSEDDFWLVAAENFRIDKVKETLEGPGYIHIEEATRDLQKRDTKWSLDIGTLNYNEFKFETEYVEKDAISFYDRNSFRYELPERMQVSYVFFPSERFVEEVPTPEDEEINKFYEDNKALFPGKTTVEDAREEVIQKLKIQNAKPIAEKFAYNSFALQLYRQEIKEKDSAEFKALISKLELEVKAIEPYTKNGAPPHDVVSRKVLANAFNMTRYYSDPYTVDKGVVVLIKDGIIDAKIPAYEQVQGQVAQDFKEDQRRKAFVEHGKEISIQLNEAQKKQTNFALNAAKADLDVQPHRDFTLMDPPSELPRDLLSSMETLEVNEVSAMITKGNKGYFLCLIEKNAPELKADDEAVVKHIELQQQRTKQYALQSIIGNMIALGQKALEPEAN